MDHRPCRDFRRAQLLRHSCAQAGRGLPSIEPGMPLPAGTGMDRRSFLLRGAGLGLSVYAASRLQGLDVLEAGVAHAAERGGRPVVVSVYLDGGLDGLSTLAPVGDRHYRRLRPTLALPEGGRRFTEDDRLRWHPAAGGLATLHAEGKLTVLPAVGYTDADQSHFTSRHFWEVGATDAGQRSGWLGRWLDTVGTADNPVQGLSLDGQLSPLLASRRVPVAALNRDDDYTLGVDWVSGPIAGRMQQAVSELGAAYAGASDAALRQAGTAAGTMVRLSDQMAPFTVDRKASPVAPAPYPASKQSPFPAQLANLARLLAGGLPTRAVAVRGPGGYDTHEGQPGYLDANLRLLGDTLLAFQRDLETRGVADRVITLVWSEFGRRLQENGSRGTDHGAAGLGFVLGTRVTGRMIGEFPGLARPDAEGNLRATSDYRALYASILEQWLGTDAAEVIPGAARMGRVRVIR